MHEIEFLLILKNALLIKVDEIEETMFKIHNWLNFFSHKMAINNFHLRKNELERDEKYIPNYRPTK